MSVNQISDLIAIYVEKMKNNKHIKDVEKVCSDHYFVLKSKIFQDEI
jgi:hypothetical protein